MKFSIKELTAFERILWITSLSLVTISCLLSKSFNALTLAASMIGVTALIFCSKGKVIGQVLIIIFAILYGIISFEQKYYGEMITYIGMTAPIAGLSVYTWIKNPYEDSDVVKVRKLSLGHYIFLAVAAIIVTTVFYFILKFLGTNSLFFSTLSVTTSFSAATLTMLRSENYAICYAANDIVLIILWIIASIKDNGYFTMIICFLVFLINDIYGFINWRRLKREQSENKRGGSQ